MGAYAIRRGEMSQKRQLLTNSFTEIEQDNLTKRQHYLWAEIGKLCLP